MQRLQVGDQVVVISGDHKGAKGKVSRVDLEKGRVAIAGVNTIKRHVRATQQRAGGVVEIDGPIALAAVMPVDAETGKPTRVRAQRSEAGKRGRFARSGAAIVAQK